MAPAPPPPVLPQRHQSSSLAPSSLNDLCHDISNIQQLARQGSWRPLLDAINHARKLSLPHFPHEQLVYHAYLVLAHMKLRNYGAASDELAAFADLDCPEYLYQHYPSLYPGRTGSMVPFVLRWLHAELPHRLGQTSVTIERLYGLFNRCQQRIDRLQVCRDPTELASTIAVEERDAKPGFSFDARSSSEFTGLDAPPFLNGADSLGHDEKNGISSSNPRKDNCVSSSPPSALADLDGVVAMGDSLVKEMSSLSTGEISQDHVDQINFSSSSTKSADPGEVGSPPIDASHTAGDHENISSQRVDAAEGMAWKDANGNLQGGKADPAEGMTSKDGNGNGGKGDRPGSPESDPDFGEFVTGIAAACDDPHKPRETDADWTAASATNALRRWQHRQEFVMNSIVSHHLNQKDFVVVLKWIKQLVRKHPTDPHLLSKLGYVQMQFGDLTGAKDTFSKVEDMVSHATVGNSWHSSYLKGLVSRNRGLQNVVLKQYAEAIKEFDAAIKLNPADVVSANNKALCLMYSRDLIGSTKVLESVLDKVPLVALNESLVLNLCSMYELAFVNNIETKKRLSDWILQVAPDDFDLSCTRL